MSVATAPFKTCKSGWSTALAIHVTPIRAISITTICDQWGICFQKLSTAYLLQYNIPYKGCTGFRAASLVELGGLFRGSRSILTCRQPASRLFAKCRFWRSYGSSVIKKCISQHLFRVKYLTASPVYYYMDNEARSARTRRASNSHERIKPMAKYIVTALAIVAAFCFATLSAA